MKRDSINDEKTTKMKHLIFGPKEKSPLKKELKAKPKEIGDNNKILRIKNYFFSFLSCYR